MKLKVIKYVKQSTFPGDSVPKMLTESPRWIPMNI